MDMPFPMPPAGGAPTPGAPMPGAPAPTPGAGTGPVTAPSPFTGNMVQGTAAVKLAIELLSKALPSIPMGSKLHTAVGKAVVDLGKNLEDGGRGADPAAAMQQLIEMARSAKTNPNALAALPQGGAPGGAPQPPATPAPPMGG